MVAALQLTLVEGVGAQQDWWEVHPGNYKGEIDPASEAALLGREEASVLVPFVLKMKDSALTIEVSVLIQMVVEEEAFVLKVVLDLKREEVGVDLVL